jgi:hypothetical protein
MRQEQSPLHDLLAIFCCALHLELIEHELDELLGISQRVQGQSAAVDRTLRIVLQRCCDTVPTEGVLARRRCDWIDEGGLTD